MDAVLTNEIPMDALTALVTEHRQRYTTEAESFRVVPARQDRGAGDARGARLPAQAGGGHPGDRRVPPALRLCPVRARTGPVIGPEPSVGRATMTAVPRPGSRIGLVGRDAEQAELLAALDRVRDGRAGAVLLSGTPASASPGW